MSVEERAAVHAALGDVVRLRVVDALRVSDRSPVELRRVLDIESNLLAHHLGVLDAAGLIERSRSGGDGRRRYLRLRHSRASDVLPSGTVTRRGMGASPALFVCTANSARSQLAAALWRTRTGATAASAGTHPTSAVNPAAVQAGARAGLDLSGCRPRPLPAPEDRPSLVITVCDRAHEEAERAGLASQWWHWSIPDPVEVGTREAFDSTVFELRRRIDSVLGAAGSHA